MQIYVYISTSVLYSQALFTKTVFAETIQAYKDDGIDAADITYTDNSELIITFEAPQTVHYDIYTYVYVHIYLSIDLYLLNYSRYAYIMPRPTSPTRTIRN